MGTRTRRAGVCVPHNAGSRAQALKAAKSGMYCGPLRLLAVEVYERLNQDGCHCNLVTGQERAEVPGATHSACTVEMASTANIVDVAVIDEIQVLPPLRLTPSLGPSASNSLSARRLTMWPGVQLMASQTRGWAWTRALLGVPATEIHVCGDPSCLALVQNLCNVSNMTLTVHRYERLTPLSLDTKGLKGGSYANVQPGDCVVAFSRRDLYAIKRQVEADSGFRAAMIYGALPPAARRSQAKLFNDSGSPFQVRLGGQPLQVRDLVPTIV